MTEPVISVVGGTGAQGGGVVDALLAQGTFKVRVASRNPTGGPRDRSRATRMGSTRSRSTRRASRGSA